MVNYEPESVKAGAALVRAAVEQMGNYGRRCRPIAFTHPEIYVRVHGVV